MSRPTGLASWNPRGDSLRLVENVNAVLAEYRQFLPVTGRQVFYRLVGAYGYDKTEKAYKNLLEKINRARRAGLIDWDAIRDDTISTRGAGGYHSVDSLWETFEASAEHFRHNRMARQPVHVELWVEAGGMVPQMAQATVEYGPTVYSSGGFNSTTMKRDAAVRFRRRYYAGRRTVLLHIGDHDPSGVAIYDNLNLDLHHFLVDMGCPWDALECERVAVTADQAEEMGLESAPPKASDSRSVNWYGETWQAEAIPPGTLQQMALEAVERHMDPGVHQATLDSEEESAATLMRWLEMRHEEEE